MKRKRIASIMRNEGKAGFRNRGKKAAPPDPSQNLHVAKGAPVTVDEVRAHGLPGCASCSGAGRTPRGVICSCATRRFMKAHPEIIVDRVGYSWWPATVKPAPTASMRVPGSVAASMYSIKPVPQDVIATTPEGLGVVGPKPSMSAEALEPSTDLSAPDDSDAAR